MPTFSNVCNGLKADIDPIWEITDPKSMVPYLTLRAWWSETGAGIETRGAPEAEIAALENRYRVSLPHEFREYLKLGAPKKENWDAEDGNWWPIERIKNVPDEYDHPVSEVIRRNAPQHLIFLDYSIWACAWAISCADDETRGRVAIIDGLRDGYVADSFGEFVERYTTDWLSIGRVQA